MTSIKKIMPYNDLNMIELDIQDNTHISVTKLYPIEYQGNMARFPGLLSLIINPTCASLS